MACPTSDLFAKSQFLSAPTQLTMTASSVRSAKLARGMYLLYSSTAVAWLQGDVTVTATSASIPLPLGTFFGPIYVADEGGAGADSYIAAIAASGTVSIIPVT